MHALARIGAALDRSRDARVRALHALALGAHTSPMAMAILAQVELLAPLPVHFFFVFFFVFLIIFWAFWASLWNSEDS